MCEPEWSVSAYHPCYVIGFSFTLKKNVISQWKLLRLDSVWNTRLVQLQHVLSYYQHTGSNTSSNMDTQVLLNTCSVFCSLHGGTLLLQGWEQIAWNTIFFQRLVSQRLWYIQSQLFYTLIVTDVLVSSENLFYSMCIVVLKA